MVIPLPYNSRRSPGLPSPPGSVIRFEGPTRRPANDTLDFLVLSHSLYRSLCLPLCPTLLSFALLCPSCSNLSRSLIDPTRCLPVARRVFIRELIDELGGPRRARSRHASSVQVRVLRAAAERKTSSEWLHVARRVRDPRDGFAL